MNIRATLLWLAIAVMAWFMVGCAGDGRDHDAHANAHGHSHSHDHDHEHDHVHSHAEGHEHVQVEGVGSSHPEFLPTAPCTCRKDIYHHTWCRHCNIGHIAGKGVSSAMLFSTIDAHGHDLDLTTITCETCRANISTGGFCEPCSTGFYNKQAYFTKLTWGIAQGAAINPRELQCATCMQSFGKTGWCDACGQGFIGNVATADRDIYDATAPEHAVFLAAIDKTDECEECACAMVMHRTCPKCQISYATNASLTD